MLYRVVLVVMSGGPGLRVDACEGHFPARELDNPVGRFLARGALAVKPALNAPGLVAPPGSAGFDGMCADVGFKFHSTDSDTNKTTCQAPTVIFFTVGAGTYNGLP